MMYFMSHVAWIYASTATRNFVRSSMDMETKVKRCRILPSRCRSGVSKVCKEKGQKGCCYCGYDNAINHPFSWEC